VAAILIIDDEFSFVETLAEILRWDGHDVRTAANGLDGLGSMRARKPDVVLLDYMMPRMDGRQMLAVMRQDPLLRAIPVVLMTAARLEGERNWEAHLHKPFGLRALQSALAPYLED
jgi:CheY-like chemotaxis protein